MNMHIDRRNIKKLKFGLTHSLWNFELRNCAQLISFSYLFTFYINITFYLQNIVTMIDLLKTYSSLHGILELQTEPLIYDSCSIFLFVSSALLHMLKLILLLSDRTEFLWNGRRTSPGTIQSGNFLSVRKCSGKLSLVKYYFALKWYGTPKVSAIYDDHVKTYNGDA